MQTNSSYIFLHSVSLSYFPHEISLESFRLVEKKNLYISYFPTSSTKEDYTTKVLANEHFLKRSLFLDHYLCMPLYEIDSQ